jgi:GNAT superfamily N-acetyltransferase
MASKQQNITIKKMEDAANDLVLLNLQKRALPGDYPLEPSSATTFWIAYVGNKPAAFAALSAPLKAEKEAAHLSRCGVLKEYRGRGIQKLLIAARLKAAKEEGHRFVVTDTRAWNAPSINSLIASGFRAYKPKRPWMATGTCYWIKDLSK